MARNQGLCFFIAAVMTLALLPEPTMSGRLELRNEIEGVAVRKAKLSLRCRSNEDDLGWDVIKPMEYRLWKFTTMNMWPFHKTEFRCQFRSGFGTTSQEVVTVFSVRRGFRRECGFTGDECTWVAKRDGFYLRKAMRDKDDRKTFVDILKSKWVWKW